MSQQVLSASCNAVAQQGISSGSIPPSLLPIVRFAFYLFIFVIPFETLDIGIEPGVFSLAHIMGYLFIGAALLQPKVCFGKPPNALKYFVAYLLVFALLAIDQKPEYKSLTFSRAFMLFQMLVLFWVSFNLFKDRRLVKGALLALASSCALIALLQVTTSVGGSIGQGRVTALSEDANNYGSVLSLGLLALLGLTYGRAVQDGKRTVLTWTCFGVLAAGIVLTGSRGALLSLIIGILFLTANPGRPALKFKKVLIAVFAISVLAWVSYENDTVRLRWERALSKGSISGREEILPAAWNMFTEKPLVGWGPISNYMELGSRFGRLDLDTHNTYVWILTETGLLGAIPFFIGLWLCWRAGWRGRHGTEGSLPIALLVCLLAVNMSLTWHTRKLFWVVLAYSLASESLVSKRSLLPHPVGSIEKIGDLV